MLCLIASHCGIEPARIINKVKCRRRTQSIILHYQYCFQKLAPSEIIDEEETNESTPITNQLALVKQHAVLKSNHLDPKLSKLGFTLLPENVNSAKSPIICVMLLNSIAKLFPHFRSSHWSADSETENESKLKILSLLGAQSHLLLMLLLRASRKRHLQ